MKYGEHTEKIQSIIGQVQNLTPEQAERLDAARDAARGDAWVTAWDAARNAAWYASRDAVCDATWAAIQVAVRSADYDAVLLSARSAILALLVKGRISEDQFAILGGPWDSVMK